MCNFAFVRTFGCSATAAKWIMILDAGHALINISWSMLLGSCCLFLRIFLWLPYWLVHLLLHCLVIWILMLSVQHCHHWISLKMHTNFFCLFFICAMAYSNASASLVASFDGVNTSPTPSNNCAIADAPLKAQVYESHVLLSSANSAQQC